MGRKQARFCAVLLGMTTTTTATAALATGSQDAGLSLSWPCGSCPLRWAISGAVEMIALSIAAGPDRNETAV